MTTMPRGIWAETFSLIENATDAQLAGLAQMFAQWIKSPDCDEVVLATCAIVCGEIIRRNPRPQPALATEA